MVGKKPVVGGSVGLRHFFFFGTIAYDGLCFREDEGGRGEEGEGRVGWREIEGKRDKERLARRKAGKGISI